MSHERTCCISILFYTNKHDKIKIICVILEEISSVYSAKEFLKRYTQYCAKISILSKSQLHKYKKFFINIKNAELDLNFLSNCFLYNVIPNFLAFNLPYSNDEDTRFIRKNYLEMLLRKERMNVKK